MLLAGIRSPTKQYEHVLRETRDCLFVFVRWGRLLVCVSVNMYLRGGCLLEEQPSDPPQSHLMDLDKEVLSPRPSWGPVLS